MNVMENKINNVFSRIETQYKRLPKTWRYIFIPIIIALSYLWIDLTSLFPYGPAIKALFVKYGLSWENNIAEKRQLVERIDFAVNRIISSGPPKDCYVCIVSNKAYRLCALLDVEIINTCSKTIKITSYSTETFNDGKWIPLHSIKIQNSDQLYNFYYTKPKDATSFKVCEGFFYENVNTFIPSGGTLKGWMLYEWPKEIKTLYLSKVKIKVNFSDFKTQFFEQSLKSDDSTICDLRQACFIKIAGNVNLDSIIPNLNDPEAMAWWQ